MWKRRLWAFLFGFCIIAGLVLLRAADPYPLRVARETSFDFFQQLRPRAAPDLPIRIVDIDERSLAEIGQWPWSRHTMATLTQRLTELGAAAIAFDVLFPEPDRLSPSASAAGGVDYDAEFAAALAGGPSILSFTENGNSAVLPQQAKAGFAMTGADPLPFLPTLTGAALPMAQLADAATGLGVASLDQENTGVPRRLPLLWSNGTSAFPALSVEALRVAVGASTLVVLGDTTNTGTIEALRIGDITVPTGPSGDLWLYYRHLGPSTYVSARNLLADDYASLAPQIAGNIVFVGASASGLLDVRQSPLGEPVPGVSIHVQALEQMLTGVYLNRADWVGGLEILIFVLSGIAITLAIIFTGPLIGLGFSVMVALVTTAASWFAFTQYGLLLDPSFALLGALIVYAAMAFFQFAITDSERRRIRNAFAHYVAPSLLTQIENNAESLRLGGDVRELTVMFSDVRNFSAISEKTAPADLVRMLNTLFGALGAAIIEQMGTIDKFMGDAVMAFWNAPVDVERHALRACQAALAMREALGQLNQTNLSQGAEPIAIGIGIASGPALVGNMGFEARFDYSCVGETVNVASRLESACKTVLYDILVTRETRDAVAELALLDAGSIALKGMSEREPIHLLLGSEGLATSAAFANLAACHDRLLLALRAGEPALAEIAECRALAAFDARLPAFYDAIVTRRADFAPDMPLN
ncbi:adenylate cyclase [Devosia sp. UYZn731]|uniref:CHASE2 domain-containing protein n=1 Tax=Devosia sp. UYZn731 TaxID=3156345 RepID=UPI0033946390